MPSPDQSSPSAGVIGWPLTHTRSPVLHGYWLKKYSLAGSYARIAIAPENFAAEFRNLGRLGYVGVNVTIPYKESALRQCDELDANAARLGAVNTIVIRNGRFYGSNTDGFGFMENLRNGAPDWSPGKGPAIILGAGGAARAVVAALQDAHVPLIKIFNRSRDRAQSIASDLGGDILAGDWKDRSEALLDANLLVNCSSLGMRDQPPLEIALDHLPVQALVNDIVYTPLQTDLLRAAQARGNRCVDGLGMLLHQARPGFAAWFGVMPEVDDALRNLLLADSETTKGL